MAKTLRVHQLAKELGVKSKAIVEKCQAEGVPDITNHMSTVKLGLAETIRQWFDEAHNDGTAIETAEKVDLTKVRAKKARKKAKAAGEDAGSADHSGESTTATLEAPEQEAPAEVEAPEAAAAPEPEEQPAVAAEAEQPAPVETAEAPEPVAAVEEPEPVEAAPEEAAPAVAAEAPEAVETPAAEEPEQAEPVAEQPAPEAVAEQAPATDAVAEQDSGEATEAPAEDESEGKAKAKVRPVGIANVPDRPNVIKPVGKQLDTPKKAQMKGPKVVRIEKPEPVRQPRPRRGPGGPGGPSGGPPSSPGEVPGISRSRGPSRGRGAGGPEPDSGNRGKRRTLSTRRGRSADALLTGPTKFSKADLDELDARLKGSTGYLKQRRRDMRKRQGGHQAVTPAVTGGKVVIQEPITIKSLSSETGIKTADIIKYLFTQKKVMATVNSAIDSEAAMEVAMEYDIELDVKAQETAEQKVEKEFAERQAVDSRPRPPVVAVLGHVDHGKTSLLDRIRKEDVAAHEAGGITQHVGAYRVTIDGTDGSEKTVVFLDTPGHEAFTSMRSRGASVTDLVVLVVAADDGVMPTTIESINHAKAAGVPIIVALNKIDLAQATDENIHRIYGQLSEQGLNPVDWGGETEIIKTSAETGQGITDLMEILDYQAELLELQADYGGAARGTVIESEMQPGRGSVARVLVQDGQIRVGDFVVAGRAFGRVRDMSNDKGQRIDDAGPATPLELSGIDAIPDAGDKFFVTDTLRKAEDVAKQYRETERHQMLATKTKVTLDNFAEQLKAGEAQELRVVLKADVQGSIDVLRQSLEKLGNAEVVVRVLHAAVGGITESDIELADASDGIIIGFHVAATPAVREIAEERGVDMRFYRVIYDVTDEVRKSLEGMLTPDRKEIEIGRASVKEVFRISKLGNVAGCLVQDGAMRRDGTVRIVRDGAVVTEGRKISDLRRVKNEVREVQVGTECGLRVEGFEDIKPGDEIVCYRVEEVARTLD